MRHGGAFFFAERVRLLLQRVRVKLAASDWQCNLVWELSLGKTGQRTLAPQQMTAKQMC